MSTIVSQTLSNGTVSTSTANCIQGSARAWVNYNGSTQTVAGSYNVSSVTYVGAGDYTINFTNAFANTNYVPVPTSFRSAAGDIGNAVIAAMSTTSCSLSIFNSSSTRVNTTMNGIAVFSS